MDLTARIRETIRDVRNFPKQGIIFKDITPVLANPDLSKEVSYALAEKWRHTKPDGIIGIESRGFIYGMQMAQLLSVPFIPVRKAGKLPFQTIRHSYELEYGSAEIEIHVDAIKEGDKILIHDDLLATGGTAEAAASLVTKMGGEVLGYSFLIELDALKGRDSLLKYADEIHSLIHY